MRRALLCTMLALAVGSLGACNTLEGIGKDTKAVGRAIGIGGEESSGDQD